VAAGTHYTAVLEVQKVTVTDAVRGRYANDPTTPASRDVAEVARVVIRSESLTGLVAKLAAHAELLS
jgi:hypothetical protein